MPDTIGQQIVWEFVPNTAPMDAAFVKADSKAKQHVSSVNTYFKEVGKTINIGTHFDSAAKKTESSAKEHVGRLNSIFSKVGEGITSKLGGIASGVASVFGGGFALNALSGAESAVSSLAQAGLDFAENWEKAHLRMTAFTGDAHEATIVLKQLQQISVDRAMQMQPLSDAAFKLAEIGIQGDKAVNIMKGITAQAAVLGRGAEGVNSIVMQLEMMVDSGKAAGQGLMRLERQGYQVFQTLSKMTGISNIDLRKMMMQGRLDPKVAIELLTEGWEKQFGEAANKITHTFSDEQTRTMNALAPQLATAMGPIIDAAGHTMKDIQAVINQAGPGFAEGISGAMSLAAGAMTKALDYLIELAGIKLETHSPSKVFERMGTEVMQGLGNGFIQGQDKAQRALEETYRKIVANADLQKIVVEAAKKFNLPVELINAVIAKESAGKVNALSPAGAKGLMQLMDPTAARHGVTNPYNAYQNIMGGSAELSGLLGQYGTIPGALAHYNWSGRGAMPAETRDYVDRITRLLGTDVGGAASAGGGGGRGIQDQIDAARIEIQNWRESITKLNQDQAERFERINRIRDVLGYIGMGQESSIYNRTYQQGVYPAPLLPEQEAERDKARTNLTMLTAAYGEGVKTLESDNLRLAAVSKHLDDLVRGYAVQSAGSGVSATMDFGTAAPLVMKLAGKGGAATTASPFAAPTVLQHLDLSMSTYEKTTEEASASVAKLAKSAQDLYTEEQKRTNALKVSRMESVFGEAGRRLGEGMDPFGARQAEVDALVNTPKQIAAVAGQFLTNFKFSMNDVRQILSSGLKSVVVEPFAKIVEAQITKWVTQMMIDLLGRKAMQTEADVVTIDNTMVTGLNTAAITALTTAITAQTGSSFFDTLIQGAAAAGENAAGGADFIVPPGYPDDSYRLNLTSDEHVMVAPAGKRLGGGKPQQTIHQYNITMNAPIVGGSSYAAPKSQREYMHMWGAAMQDIMKKVA